MKRIYRIAEVVKLMMDVGLVVMSAYSSPLQRECQMARELILAEHGWGQQS